MRIAIDGLPLTEPLAGVGHYTLELARRLALDTSGDEVEIISPRPFIDSARLAESARLHYTLEKVNPITARWWSIGLPRLLKKLRPDIFHGTNFEVPLRSMCPTVLTIHDLSLLLYPQTHERRRVRRARRRLPQMARKATMIITVSEVVRHEVHQHLQIPLDRIKTVHSAVRDLFKPMDDERAKSICRQLNIPDNFVFYAGTIEPRKNLSLLVRAFAEVSTGEKSTLQLVIAGKRGWLVDEFYDSLRRSPALKNVVFTGYLNDEQLCALYSRCRLFLYPSLYEGFGFPPLEAMACGAPVIASRISAIEEVAGPAAFLVAHDSAAELSSAINRMLADESLRREMIARGVERVKQFSWSVTAEKTRAVYREAIERFNRPSRY